MPYVLRVLSISTEELDARSYLLGIAYVDKKFN